MPEFIPGLALNEAYYWQAIRPILDRHYPGLPYAAARIGDGSEVLAFAHGKGSVEQFLVESSGALQDVAFCRSLKGSLIEDKK